MGLKYFNNYITSMCMNKVLDNKKSIDLKIKVGNTRTKTIINILITNKKKYILAI